MFFKLFVRFELEFILVLLALFYEVNYLLKIFVLMKSVDFVELRLL